MTVDFGSKRLGYYVDYSDFFDHVKEGSENDKFLFETGTNTETKIRIKNLVQTEKFQILPSNQVIDRGAMDNLED